MLTLTIAVLLKEADNADNADNADEGKKLSR